MNFKLTEDQLQLQDAAREFARAELPAIAAELERDNKPPSRDLVKRYAETIPSVAPDQELTNIWFQTDFRVREEKGKPLPNREPTPEKVTVTITYRSDRRRYTDTFPLDVDVVRMMTYSTSSNSLPGRMESMEKSLKALGESAREMARAARYVRRDEIREEEAAAIAEMEAFREKQRQQREADKERG